MKNKAAAALGGKEAEQFNSSAAESPTSAVIKAFKSDVTLGRREGRRGEAKRREEGEGEIFKSAAGSHSGTTLVSRQSLQQSKNGGGALTSNSQRK